MLQCTHVHLLSPDRLDDLVVEKGDFPLILVESLWEVFEVAFSEIDHVLLGYEALNCALTLVLLDKDAQEELP